MAVARNSSGTNFVNGTASSLSLTTLTIGGASRLLLVAVHMNKTTDDVTALTWNGVDLLAAGTILTFEFNSNRIQLYRLVAPDAGNFTLAVTFSAPTTATLGAVNFEGVDQTTPIVTGDNATASGTSTSPSVTVTSDASDATVAFDVCNNQYHSASTQTLEYTDTGVETLGFRASYALGGASNAHGFTLNSSQNWAAAGVHLAAAVAAGTLVGAEDPWVLAWQQQPPTPPVVGVW